MEEIFAKALNSFTMDMAAGDAIRHLADLGYGPAEIQARLTYPAPMNYIGKTVYEHLLNKNIIVLKDPAEEEPTPAGEFILEHNKYGKTSYRRVPKNEAASKGRKPEDYIRISFGHDKYIHKSLIEASKKEFSSKAWDYLINMPWPLENIWHLKDEKILEIIEVLGKLDAQLNKV